jgi:hypothetical protein
MRFPHPLRIIGPRTAYLYPGLREILYFFFTNGHQAARALE